LRALMAATEPVDLRQSAAQALVSLGDDVSAAQVLVECLTAPGADPAAAETALEAWMSRRARGGDAAAERDLDRWRKLAGDTRETPTAARSVERQKQRAMLFSAGLSSGPASAR
jgi:hypothetical protein